ncbi:MAG: DUF6184 family natural product biosynthesis lipoprotein [Myxococcota bacterium]
MTAVGCSHNSRSGYDSRSTYEPVVAHNSRTHRSATSPYDARSPQGSISAHDAKASQGVRDSSVTHESMTPYESKTTPDKFAYNTDNRQSDAKTMADYNASAMDSAHAGHHPVAGYENKAPRKKGPSPWSRAVEKLATARCNLEMRCKNIGAERKYKTVKACRADVRGDLGEELNAYDCSAGIDESELKQCLQAINTQDCANPFESLSRIVQCRSAALCASTDK